MNTYLKTSIKTGIIITCTVIFCVSMVYFFVQVPANNWAFTDTEAQFNSMDTCTGLVMLDAHLDQDLSHNDYLQFQKLIKQKVEELKCP